MMKIGIFYGSTTGNTENAARAIRSQLEPLGQVALHNIADCPPARMADYDLILLGSSTWGVGELQDNWAGHEDLDGVDLTGKYVALFGTGDQMGFSDTFVDAMGLLANAALKAGATLVGKWPTEGYDFTQSGSVQEDRFVGLALDEDNQSDQTDDRISQWTEQLKGEVTT